VSHTYKYNNNIRFHFNSDFSGNVQIEADLGGACKIPASSIHDFLAYYEEKYKEKPTMSDQPKTKLFKESEGKKKEDLVGAMNRYVSVLHANRIFNEKMHVGYAQKSNHFNVGFANMSLEITENSNLRITYFVESLKEENPDCELDHKTYIKASEDFLPSHLNIEIKCPMCSEVLKKN